MVRHILCPSPATPPHFPEFLFQWFPVLPVSFTLLLLLDDQGRFRCPEIPHHGDGKQTAPGRQLVGKFRRLSSKEPLAVGMVAPEMDRMTSTQVTDFKRGEPQ